jgi:guanine nucleotide-binding protein G(i) subunit alpha
VLLEGLATMGIQLANPQNQSNYEVIMAAPNQIEADVLPTRLTQAIQQLWQDRGVQEVYSRKREIQLNDSSFYYFNNINTIGREDYLPSDQDILRSRVKSTGITETTFRIGELVYKLFDVGGQRSERKKWSVNLSWVSRVAVIVLTSRPRPPGSIASRT